MGRGERGGGGVGVATLLTIVSTAHTCRRGTNEAVSCFLFSPLFSLLVNLPGRIFRLSDDEEPHGSSSLSMTVLVFWFSPLLCVAVPVLTVTIPLVVYVSSYYCVCVCVSRQSQQDQGASGMMLKTGCGEEAADEMDNQEGK